MQSLTCSRCNTKIDFECDAPYDWHIVELQIISVRSCSIMVRARHDICGQCHKLMTGKAEPGLCDLLEVYDPLGKTDE